MLLPIAGVLLPIVGVLLSTPLSLAQARLGLPGVPQQELMMSLATQPPVPPPPVPQLPVLPRRMLVALPQH